MTTSSTNSSTNLNIQEISKAFAKANKVSHTKIEALINEVLLAALPAEGEKHTSPITRERNGKASQVVKMIVQMPQGQCFTSLELADALEMPVGVVNNAIQYQGRIGKIERTDETKHQAMGRPAIVWRKI